MEMEITSVISGKAVDTFPYFCRFLEMSLSQVALPKLRLIPSP